MRQGDLILAASRVRSKKKTTTKNTKSHRTLNTPRNAQQPGDPAVRRILYIPIPGMYLCIQSAAAADCFLLLLLQLAVAVRHRVPDGKTVAVVH